MTTRSKLILFVMLVSIFASPLFVHAQSGRTPEESVTTTTQEKQTQTPTNANNLERVKLIVVRGCEGFIKELNDNGKAGYRLEKSLNFGGEGATQNYAAVLRLDSDNTYEYDWFSSPNKNLLESRLNYQAAKGFNFANAFALTSCSDDAGESTANPALGVPLIVRLSKGDAFLLERRNGDTNQHREYKVFVGKIGFRGKPKQAIQDALDAVPQGFRPVKILFAKQGLLDFSVSVLLEKNLLDDNATKIEYRFIKEVSGFEKAVNTLAAQGFRFIGGRRIGLTRFVLMAKQDNDATAYTFVETEKYAKEFDKTIAQGNAFVSVMAGDLSCNSTKIENERLVFARNSSGEKRDFKIYNVFNEKSSNRSVTSLIELQSQVGQGYQVKSLFYSDRLNVVFEK